jgi:PAS domain S-box-containing protein
MDEEFVLYRAHHSSERGSPSVLVLAPASQHPSLATLKKIEHEYSLRHELDSAWAVRPLALSEQRGQTMLALEDPGGDTLEKSLSGPMETAQFLRFAIGLATALGGLHGRRLIHKDVKPANALINSATGQIRLMGFGIASRLPRERQPPQPPETIAGTLAYMAPEQTGRMNRSIDARSDLYALGITLYEMLTGSRPFIAVDPMEWVHCHIARQPTPPSVRVPYVAASVSAIIMKLLAKTAEDRYQTAAGLERDLRRCLAQFEAEGRIDDFALGEHETPDRLLIPEKLYGRGGEIESLLTAFDRIVKGGAPELVLVSGYSGIGKSSVVNELHKVLVPPRGLFAAGKFDQYKRDIPYSTLAQAFQDLVRPLLGKSEGELARWCDALKEAMGPNGQLMVDLVPELRLIIGDQAPVPELAPLDAQRRFQLVFRRFLAVFARAEHPLALFLDDLQGLDAATLDLLEDLLTQPDIRHLLLIGAYRDNEVTSIHPLMRRLETLRNGGALVQEIVLTPLTGEDVSRLIAESLCCDRGGAMSLAQLVLEKTDGNPFFVIQFLSAMVEEELLTFDHGAGRWSWDLTRIHAKGYTDNVVDLMVGKLSRLPLITQEALKGLACLGNSAKASTLATVQGTPEKQLHSDLWEALRLELIDRSDDLYRFVHDRVQEAAYSLVSEEQRAQAHLRIGRLLASHIEPEQREEAVFEIVGHFNRAAALVTSEEERDQVAALNLVAGKRAKKAVAFASALSYLTAGSALVAGDGWERRHDLVFELELHRAECEFLTGDMSAAEQHLRILSSRAADTVQRAAVACLLVDVHWALQQPDRGLAECLECLRHAGLEIPRHPTKAQAQAEYDRICSKLDGVGIDELAELPLLADPIPRAILDVMAKVAPTAVITDMNLLSLLICAAVDLGLERGHCDSSCFAYEYLGVIAGWHFGDFAACFRFGRLGHELVARKGLRGFESFVCLIFSSVIMPWARHIASCRELLRATFEVANKNGDRHSAVCCRTELVSHLLWSGEPLVEAQTEADVAVEFCRRAAFRDYIDRANIQAAFIRNLRGLTRQFGSLDDEQFNELRMQTHFESQPHLVACEFWYWVTQLQARFLARNYAAAIDASIRAEGLLSESRRRGQLCACEAFRVESEFYCALAHAAACDSAFGDEGRQHVNAAAGHLQELELWARHCPENFENRAALVAAELARIEGRDRDATQLYEQAIRSAREHGFVHHEALALELAAQFYAARGFDRIAKAYLRDARSGYRQWGADGKVRQLEAQYPYLTDEHPSSDPTRTVLTSVEHLDLSTLLKLSQAVQGETDLDELIAAVMRLGLEHAGAERGLLLLPHSDGYRIEAEAKSRSEGVTVDLRRSSIGAGDLPPSVLQYVLRTRERVLVQDAAATSEFADDAYLRQHHARSVLCIPLLKQTRLVGIIYLENNLTSGAFTAARMALLEVLASDAAISLENALLYQDLQERERESRLIVDSIPGLVATLTPAGEVEAVNEQVLAYCGRTLEELKQWGTSDTVHRDDLPRAIEIISDSMKSGDPYEIVERVRRFDGVYRWFQVRGLPLRDSNGSIVRWYVLLTDIDERKCAEGLLAGEKRLLEMVASGRPLRDVLEAMCGLVETLVSKSMCSILLIDPNGKFQHEAGPTVPPGYDGTVNGVPVVCEAGPCGTAASLKEQVIVADLVSDPRWVGLGWRTLVLEHGLRSVCSTPIVSLTGTVVGTFAIYQREPGPPSAPLKELIARFTHVASIAIERTNSEAEIRALKDQLYRENLVLRDEVDRTSMFEEIVGTSKALNAVLSRLSKVAPTDSTVLIMGETGTGKELVARAIHRRSARGPKPFVSVNCAAVPRELIASELFGHEKGAFTGATQRRLGRFELAHGGTIFLDEVGELPIETQVALLRVLQERQFERVGGSASVRVDVRVIAATNRDLQAVIEAGTFRSDLFYRLNVFPIAVPALRERADDISLLVEYFIDRYSRKTGKTIRRVNKRTLDHLRSYPWPGNVRELQNVIERSVIVCDTDEFTVDESWLSAAPAGDSRALSSTLAGHERSIIEDALRASGGRVFGPSGAAAQLGIARSTLESKIRGLGIDKNRFRSRRTNQ